MTATNLELGFWLIVLTAIATVCLLLIPRGLGRVFDGRVSGISVLVLFYYLYAVPFLMDYFLGIITLSEFPAETIPTLKVKAIGFLGIMGGIGLARLMAKVEPVRLPISFERKHLRKLLLISVILALISIPLILVGAQQLGGFPALLAMERGARFMLLRERFDLFSIGVFYLLQAGAILATFVVVGCLRLSSPLKAKLASLLLCITIILLSLFLNLVVLGVRSYPLSLVIVFLVFFTSFVRRIRAVWTLGLFAILFIIFGAVALVRELTAPELGVSGVALLGKGLPKIVYSLSYNDPGIVFRTSSNITGYYLEGGGLFHGKTYTVGLIGLIPSPIRSALGIGEMERVSQWVSKRFAERAALLGGFRAVSTDSEALLNFGLAGVLVLHLLLFLALSLMEIYASYTPAGTLVVLPIIASYSFLLRKAFDLNIHNVFYVVIFSLAAGLLIYGNSLLVHESDEVRRAQGSSGLGIPANRF